MSQKIKTSVEIDGSLSASQIANATTDTDKFLVSDGGVIKYRTGAELATDLGIAAGVTSKVQHQVKAGVAINKGQAVYVTSADGTNMIVGLASNATEATSSKTMGLLNATVSANGFADVITEGLLAGLDTSTAVAGNPVWLGTGGNLIYGLANKPYAPSHLVFIGIVTRVNANNGEIFVKVQNGFELDELHDVDLKTTTPINGHLLGFNGTLWVNKTIAGWLGYTPQAQLNGTGFVKASGTTITYDNTSYYPASNPSGYISSYTETDTLASVTSRGALTNTPISISAGTLNHLTLAERFNLIGGSNFHITNNAYYDSGFKYKFSELATKLALQSDGILSYQTAAVGTIGAAITFDTKFSVDSSGNLTVPGTLSASGYNKTNWDTAYGWGNHASAGYALSGHTHDLGRYSLRAPALIDGVTASNFRTQLFGSSTSGYNISTARFNTTPGLLSGLNNYGTMMAWSGADTHGFLAIDYAGPAAIIGGGNSDNINWTKRLAFLDDTVPNNRTITINGTSYDLSANRSWTVTATETDTLATVTARGNIANYNIALGTNAAISGGGSAKWITTDGTASYGGGLVSSVNGTAKAYYYFDGSNAVVQGAAGIGIAFQPNNSTQATLNTSGDFTANASVRTPIFYDSNDTGYYINPASDSKFQNLSIVRSGGGHDPYGVLAVSCPSGDNYSYIGLTRNGIIGAGMGIDTSNFFWFGSTSGGHNATRTSAWMQIGSSYSIFAGSVRSDMFYDQSDTSYYVDPSYVSRLGKRNYLGASSNWDAGNLSSENDSITNLHFQGHGDFWIGAGNTSWYTTATSGHHDLLINTMQDSPGYNTRGITFTATISNGSGYRLGRWYSSTSSAGSYLNVDGSIRTPLMYDSNNTGYYIDPASTSSVNIMSTSQTYLGNSSAYALGASNWAGTGGYPGYIYTGGNHRFGFSSTGGYIDVYTDGYFYCGIDPTGGNRRVLNEDEWINSKLFASDGNIYSNASMRATMFYDQNNTGYYVDPASGSSLDTANVRLLTFRGVGGDSANGSIGDMYGIYQQGGAWNYPYPDLCIGYHTGIKIGAYYSYNGTRFYNNSDWATITASVNDGDNNFRGYYDVIAYASDRRLKHKVKPIEDALSKVKSLTGMTYQWNEIGKEHGWDPDTEVREAGVFAQDVQSVLPEAVRLAPFDDEHGVSRSGENFLTVKYDKIVPLLIEAIKEQQKQIEELKELVNQLIKK